MPADALATLATVEGWNTHHAMETFYTLVALCNPLVALTKSHQCGTFSLLLAWPCCWTNMLSCRWFEMSWRCGNVTNVNDALLYTAVEAFRRLVFQRTSQIYHPLQEGEPSGEPQVQYVRDAIRGEDVQGIQSDIQYMEPQWGRLAG